MAACFRPASPAAGPAAWPSAGRRGYRGGGGGGGVGGTVYDPDAAAYIAATGELFPEALNALVAGIKAAGLWDDHVGAIKKAIGVPTLAASMVDLRNPNLAGTAFNAPVHSATDGWTFTAASSQHIDTGWKCGATDSKATQDSVHVGMRIMAASGGHPGSVDSASASNRLGFEAFSAGIQRWFGNDGTTLQTAENPATPAHFIGVRTGASARALYRDGIGLANDSQASQTPADVNVMLGARHRHGGIIDAFLTGRLELWHAGAGLTAAQSATLMALFNAYCAATVPADGLDGLATAPIIGVGMKRLHSAYAGPLVRLVRNVDDAEMDFGVDHFGNLDFLAIAAWAGGSMLLGKRWYNQFGGDDYVQTAKASMPRFSPTGINGRPCFVFDGVDDYMLAHFSVAISGSELFMAVLAEAGGARTDNDGMMSAFDSSTPSDFGTLTSLPIAWESTNQIQVARTANSTTAPGTAPSLVPIVGHARADETSGVYAGVNGTEASPGLSTGLFNVNRAVLGARRVGGVFAEFGPQSISCAVMFDHDPGESTNSETIEYLMRIGAIT